MADSRTGVGDSQMRILCLAEYVKTEFKADLLRKQDVLVLLQWAASLCCEKNGHLRTPKKHLKSIQKRYQADGELPPDLQSD